MLRHKLFSLYCISLISHLRHDADSSELAKLEDDQKATTLQLVKDFCDLGCAIHWFVPGFLWAQKLPDSVVGLLGTVSSILGFHAFLLQQQKKAK